MSELLLKLETANSVSNVDAFTEASEQLITTLEKIHTHVKTQGKDLKSYSDSLSKLSTSIGKIQTNSSKQATALENVSGRVKEVSTRVEEATQSYKNFTSAIQESKEEAKGLASEAGKAATGTKKMGTKAKKAAEDVAKLEKNTKKAKKEAKAMGNTFSSGLLGRFSGETREAIRAVLNLAKATSKGQRSGKSYGKAMSSVSSALASFSGTLLAGVALRGISLLTEGITAASRGLLQLALDVDRAKRTIAILTGDQASANREFQFAKKVANDLGLSYVAVTKEYAKFLAAGKESKIGIEGQRKVFVSFSKALAATQASAQDTELVFLALNQMISKGKVSSEELRRQLAERLPGAFQLAAKASGFTVSEFDKMIKKGAIMTDDFLPAFAKAIEDTFGKAAEEAAKGGLQASLNKMQNAIKSLGETILASGVQGAIQGIAGGITSLVNSLSDIGNIEAIRFIADVLSIAKKANQDLDGIRFTNARREINNLGEAIKKALTAGDSDKAIRLRVKQLVNIIQSARETISTPPKQVGGQRITKRLQDLIVLGAKKSLVLAESRLQKIRDSGFKAAQKANDSQSLNQKQIILASQKILAIASQRDKLVKSIQAGEVSLIKTKDTLLAKELEFNKLSKEKFDRDVAAGKLSDAQIKLGAKTFLTGTEQDKDEQRQKIFLILQEQITTKARSTAEAFISVRRALSKSDTQILAMSSASKVLSSEAQKAVVSIIELGKVTSALSVLAANKPKTSKFELELKQIKFLSQERARLVKQIEKEEGRSASLSSQPVEGLSPKSIAQINALYDSTVKKTTELKDKLALIGSQEDINNTKKVIGIKLVDEQRARARQAVDMLLSQGVALEDIQGKLVSRLGIQDQIAAVVRNKELTALDALHTRHVSINDRRREQIGFIERMVKKLKTEGDQDDRINKALIDRDKLLKDIATTNESEAFKTVARLRAEGVLFRNITLDNLDEANFSSTELAAAVKKKAEAELKALLAANGYKDALVDQVAQVQNLLDLTGKNEAQVKSITAFMEDKQSKAHQKLIKEAKDFQSIWENSADTISGAVADSILGLKTNFSDLIKHISREMLVLQVKQNIVKPFQAAITSMFTGRSDSTSSSSPTPTSSSSGGFSIGGGLTQPITRNDAFGSLNLGGGLQRPSVLGRSTDSSLAPKIIIEDHRSQSAPPVEVTRGKGLDGENSIKVMIRDAVSETILSGEQDSAMQQKYGLQGRYQ